MYGWEIRRCCEVPLALISVEAAYLQLGEQHISSRVVLPVDLLRYEDVPVGAQLAYLE